MKLGPAWSSPAERQQWEESLNAWADTLPPPPAAPAAPKPRRQPARRSLPAPRPTRHFATVSAVIINDGRLNATDIKLALWLLMMARGRASVEAFIDQIAERLGRSRRMVQYAQRNLERCGYIAVEHVREGRINDANIYHLLAPMMAPNPRRQRPSRREAVGVQKTPPHEVRVSPDLPSELVAAREEQVSGAALVARLPRAVLEARGQPESPAPAALVGTTQPARQGASAIRVRAPP